METTAKCFNCGGDYGIHQSETEHCPAGGVEARYDRRQEWVETVFVERRQRILEQAAPELLEALQEITSAVVSGKSRTEAEVSKALEAIKKATE